MIGLTLDTGALIALERHDRRVGGILAAAARTSTPVAIPAGVLAQAWRGGPRQAQLARLLRDDHVTVVPLDTREAQAAGMLVQRCGHPDVVDVSVVLCALARGHQVITCDPDDLRKVSETVELIAV